jgi:diguanylate cyclase (GGDEF)-like protein
MKPDIQELDDLTRLFSRKAFLEQFSKILVQAKAGQQESPLSLALIDVDEFKLINDQHGHVTGDNVLMAVAKVIANHVGDKALVGRYGGDEFVIIFPDQEREQAFLNLEQIRQVLSQHELSIPESSSITGITISAGVASFPMDGRTENELWRKADQALYRAKMSGRNQIRLAYEERMVPKTTHYTQTQLERLAKLAEEHGVNEADLLREAMDDFLTKYGVNDIET